MRVVAPRFKHSFQSPLIAQIKWHETGKVGEKNKIL